MFVCPECGQSSDTEGSCSEDGARLLDAAGDPLLGSLVGAYRIACRIGAGGTGEVYRGVHPAIRSRVAIKVLTAEFSTEAAAVDRFFAQARAVNLIRHENIVNVLDLSWLGDGRPYIVMEHLDGYPLSTAIRLHRVMPLGSLVALMTEVADALGAAHDQGVVHRDLKPDNIFITPGGRAKVLDFGIAKLRPDGLSTMHAATATGSILGTPHYMSPEQALGRTVDHRSDIYSLGVILFEGSTGRLPFAGDALFEILKQQIETPPPLPESLRPDLPPTLGRLILRALEKDPASRFQSAAELAQALTEVAQWLPRDSFFPLGERSSHSLSGPRMLERSSLRACGPSVSKAPALSVGSGAPLAPAQAKSPTGGRWLLALALGLCAVLLLGGAAFGLVALLWWDEIEWPWGSGTAASSNPAEGRLAPGQDSPTASSTSTDSGPSPEKLRSPDGQGVVAWEHFLQGERQAKDAFSDPGLVRIELQGVNREGVVDLGARDTVGKVRFTWRSPSQSSRGPAAPPDSDAGSPCLYTYSVEAQGALAIRHSQGGCEEPIAPRPHCNAQQLWIKADATGAPRARTARLLYPGDGSTPPNWYVVIGKNYARLLPDDCP